MAILDYNVLRELRRNAEVRSERPSRFCCDGHLCSHEFDSDDQVYIDEDMYGRQDFYCRKCALELFADGTDELDVENIKYAYELPEFYEYNT